MILYLDSSAVVKRYISEVHSVTVFEAIEGADSVVTSLITRVEVASAFAKAERMGAITKIQHKTVLDSFSEEWVDYVRLPVNEITVSRAGVFTANLELRAYDSVHLASAVSFEEICGNPIIFLTFDDRLKKAAQRCNLMVDFRK
jgi:predicted nucleic acid-binding protein